MWFLPCTMPTTYLAHQLARLRVQRRGSESYWPVRRLIHRPQTKTGSVWSRLQTSKWCTGKPDPSNLYQDEGWWPALAGVETCQWSTTHHLDPPDLSWHGCYSDWGPAARTDRSGEQSQRREASADRFASLLLLLLLSKCRIQSALGWWIVCWYCVHL